MIKTGRVEGKETGTLEMSGTLNDFSYMAQRSALSNAKDREVYNRET